MSSNDPKNPLDGTGCDNTDAHDAHAGTEDGFDISLEHEDGRTKPKRERRIRKFAYASQGFFSALRSESNLRVHCVIAILALMACFFLKVEPWGWVAVLILIGLVIFAELFNTAIETVVDLVTPEFHPLAKRAKDIAAAAVLVLACVAVVAGLSIYIPAFIKLIG